MDKPIDLSSVLFQSPGLRLLRVGQMNKEANLHCERRVLADFALVHVFKGSGFFRCRSLPWCEINAGESFLLHPGIWHSYYSGANGWSEYYAIFEGELPTAMAESATWSPFHPVSRAGNSSGLLAYWEDLMLKYQEPVVAENILMGLFYQVLIQSNLDQVKDGHLRHPIRQIMSLIHQQPQKTWDMELLAKESGWSSSRFRAVFKSVAGCSASRYVQTIRFQKAKRMLESGASVKKVANTCGYDDPLYFSRLFKKHLGLSPGSYAASLKNFV